MKVTLSPDLKDYLHKKHKDVLEVYVTQVYAERLLEPLLHLDIKFEAPEGAEADQFESCEVEGFKVFIEKDLINENRDIVFHVGKILGMRHVEVEGLEIH